MSEHWYPIEPGGKAIAPSCTAISGMLNKPGLPWGAAKETALFAIHHQDEWLGLDPDAAYERLRKHHRGVWNDKANRGTLIHGFATQWARSESVDCPPDCAPHLDALECAWIQERIRPVEFERMVVYPHENLYYGGRFDLIADLGDGRRLLIDLKTGGRYPTETTLQLSGYRYATHMAVESPLGGIESLEPMLEVDGAAVLYLHDDGTYELLDVPADRNAWAQFLHLRSVWGWQREMKTWEQSHPEITREKATA